MSLWSSIKSIGSSIWSGATSLLGNLFGGSSGSYGVSSTNWLGSLVNLASSIMPYIYSEQGYKQSVEDNKAAQERQYQYNLLLQQNQQQWAENLSSTAHQREVEDLRAAGLNPLLSAGGSGASTPSSGMGSVGLTDDGQQKMASLSTALQFKQYQQQEKMIRAEIEKRNAEVEKINSDTELNMFERSRRMIENMNLPTYYQKQFEKMEAETIFNRTSASANMINARSNLIKAEIDKQLSGAKQEEIRANTKFQNERSRKSFGRSEGYNYGGLGFHWSKNNSYNESY